MCVAGPPAVASTLLVAPSDDAFIDGGNPLNNNGASTSIFTGTDGHGGVMRGLLRFNLPPELQGRVIVTHVRLTLIMQALGDGSAGTPATESLQAVSQSWAEGNGIGDAPSSFTVGEPCGGAITGTTWTRSNCLAASDWVTAGGAVADAVSGRAATTGVPVGGGVVWDSAANTGMNSDVQAWIDSGINHGWRIASNTEGVPANAQRFDSKESGPSAPSLAVTYSCKPGYVESGNACVAVAAVPAGGRSASTLLAFMLLGAALSALRVRDD